MKLSTVCMQRLPKGQSSPGSLQSGQQPSKAIRQMPQLSSLATQRQVATPVQPARQTIAIYSRGKYRKVKKLILGDH